MQTRQLLIFVALCLLTAGVVVAAVSAFQGSSRHTQVETPATQVESQKDSDKTTVDAPFTHVEKDESGTRVEAPGVKIEVPKSPPPNP